MADITNLQFKQGLNADLMSQSDSFLDDDANNGNIYFAKKEYSIVHYMNQDEFDEDPEDKYLLKQSGEEYEYEKIEGNHVFTSENTYYKKSLEAYLYGQFNNEFYSITSKFLDDTILPKNLIVNKNTFLQDNLTVKGNSLFHTNVTIGEADGDKSGSSLSDKVQIYKPVYIGDYVDNTDYHDRSLTVYGPVTIGHQNRTQSLLVNGEMEVTNHTILKETSNFQKQVVIGAEKATSDTTNHLLYVKGDTKITGSIDVDGNAEIIGNTTILGNVAVGTEKYPKNITLNGDLSVSNIAEIGHSLVVGSGTLTSNTPSDINYFIAEAHAIVNGTTTLNGNTTIGTAATPADLTIDGNLAVYGDGKTITFGKERTTTNSSGGIATQNNVVISYAAGTSGDTLTITFND